MRKLKNLLMKNQSNPLYQEIMFLVLKILIFVTFAVITFTFIFGITRCNDGMMSTSFKDGDLVVYYRLQKEHLPTDVVVIEKDGETQVRRIIAKSGDKVDITENGLMINGYVQQENNIFVETLPYKKGIKFPIELKENEYFVLGDNRTQAKDSRVYGVVKANEIKGSVITLIRRRGF